MVNFKIQSKKLRQTLHSVKAAVGKPGKKTIAISVEITVTDNEVTFAVPGAIFSIECNTKGTCKATVPFLHFAQIIFDMFAEEAEVIITEGELNINSVKISAQTTFFETDKILRTICLPINYTDFDILRLKYEKYTDEEISFNNLNYQIELAENNLKENIESAQRKLKKYGVTIEDIEKIVMANLKAN